MKRKILVLEDEENIRSFLVLNLKRSGYEVIEAETGEIALEKYHENQDIAVAVLDVMLPGIDGYEVCRAMRGAGYQAGVYSYASWFYNQLNLANLGKYKIWIAQYRDTLSFNSRYDIWQYSSKGSVPGIPKAVDMNIGY